MDDKTYSDPEIAETINDKFVPIRVDIDRRPDISERYNRGGFPTTAFLSDRGESIWGATYVPPTDMKRIMEAILRAHDSGEIGRALERSRTHITDINKRASRDDSVDSGFLAAIFEDIFASYDSEYGGFGTEPKFPHQDVVDLFMTRYAETADHDLADAVINTLEQMLSGLLDKVEGGVFRYSVTRDWQTPHYEKLLETNTGFLRNLTQAFGIFGDRGYCEQAIDVAKYIITNLQDPESGGLFGSQDADEEYYKLPGSERARRTPPSIDRTVYAGWNLDASSALTLAGIVFENDELTDAGESAWRYSLDNLWDARLGLVRHISSEELYLFEDQVSFFNALLTQLGRAKDHSKLKLAEKLIAGVEEAFASDDGGFNDVMREERAIGDLDTPRRSLVQNSNWALALARYGAVVHKEGLIADARAILESFDKNGVETQGVFAAAYLRAVWALERGMSVAEAHVGRGSLEKASHLLSSSQRLFDPSSTSVTILDNESIAPYVVVCTDAGCSKKIDDPDELLTHLKDLLQSQRTCPEDNPDMPWAGR